MGVIIELSILIVGLVAVVVWVYNNYIYLSDKTARKIEIFGYILLFSVIIWEMVIKNILSADFYDSNWLYLEQKLFALYIMLEDILNESTYDATRIWEIFSLEDSEYIKKQLLAIDVIEAVLTVFSTICIAVGRFQDLRKGAKNEIKENTISKRLKEIIAKMFKRNKKSNYPEKYKPDAFKYIVMIIIFAFIRFVPISSGSAVMDDAFNDLAVGATASVLVTWMLDATDCLKKNKERAEKERMVFGPHTSQLFNLGYYVSRKAIRLGAGKEARSFADWLSIIVDQSVYVEEAECSQTEIYQEIRNRVLKIRETAENLMQQYTILVETDVVDTDDFSMYAGMQMNLCDSVCDRIQCGDFEEANAFLGMLLGTYATFFNEEWVERYSEADAKG